MNRLATLRAGYGLAVLAAPDELGGHIGSMKLASATRTAMRVLAARQLFEAAVCAIDPTRCVIRLEVLVDVIHGVTMAAVAVVGNDDSSRRAAAVNVLTAAGFVAADVAALRHNTRRSSSETAESHFLLRTRDRIAAAICDKLPGGPT